MYIFFLNAVIFCLWPAHKGAVRGVATDGLNQVTITAGADTCVKFWKFKTKELMETLTLDCQISRMTLHRDRWEDCLL